VNVLLALSSDELSGIVEKYPPIIRYAIEENEYQIMFHLENEKEISVLIMKNDEGFEATGQLRNKNQQDFAKANSMIKGDTELDVVKEILDNLLGYNVKRENR